MEVTEMTRTIANETRTPKGHRLTGRGKAVIADAAPVMPVESGDTPGPAVARMSAEHLADALRPLVLDHGYEYLGEPATAVATSARHRRSRRTASRLPWGVEATGQAHPHGPAGSGVIGFDDRVVVRDNTTYPWTTVAYLGGCSGTVIGPSTVLTAAHCVHNGTNWLTLPDVVPGIDKDDAQPRPFGTFDCYTVTIPSAWVNNNGGDPRFDYAVLEFSGCNQFPGNRAGWKGLWAAPDQPIRDYGLHVYGHPSDKPQPQIWGAGGAGIPNGDYVDFYVDAYYGSSGSGLYIWDVDAAPYVVGVLRGPRGALNDNSKPNFGRRVTGDVFDFIVAYSAL
jgi:V8-like Glu-specific endopeptidase